MSFLLDNHQSERLFFRKLTPIDYTAWKSFFEDAASTRFLFLPDNINTEEKWQQWVTKQESRYNHQNGLYALIDKQTDEMVGQCGLLKQDVDGIQEIEIGYHLLPIHRGKGYATEAAITCRRFVFDRALAPSVISLIHPDNFASQQVAARNGMLLQKQTLFKEHPANVYRVNTV